MEIIGEAVTGVAVLWTMLIGGPVGMLAMLDLLRGERHRV